MTAVVQFAVEWLEVAVGPQPAQPLVDHAHCRLGVEVGVRVRQLHDVMMSEKGELHRETALQSNLEEGKERTFWSTL